nr:unnamed protein product [Digitaria exilis]
MILVAIVAELMEEYTALVARVLEHLLHGAPFPRRMRFLMLRSLPFAAPPLPPPPPAHALHTVEMNVHMHCDGCEKRVRKALSRLQGTARQPILSIISVEIDMDRQKVTVTGYVDRREVLRAARRTGRAAEFWPWPYDAQYYPFAIQYLVDDTYVATDRYYRHGYNDPMIGSYPCHAFTHVIDDAALAVFHEDNVHACAVM